MTNENEIDDFLGDSVLNGCYKVEVVYFDPFHWMLFTNEHPEYSVESYYPYGTNFDEIKKMKYEVASHLNLGIKSIGVTVVNKDEVFQYD